MERTRWMVAAALLLGAGSFAACATTVDDGSGALTGADAGEEEPAMEPSEDELPPDDPNPQADDTSPFGLCHDVVCGEGEACCPSSGACYPEECFDCCYTVARGAPDLGTAAVGTHSGPNDAPAFGGPEPPRVMPSSMPEPPGPKPNE